MKTKEILAFVALVVIIVCGTMYVQTLKSNTSYAGFSCSVCGSSEILDYGTDIHGNHDCQCFDCKARYSITNE